MTKLVFLFAAGPGNIIEAHIDRSRNQSHAGQMSLTFSGEFEQFSEDVGAFSYVIGSASSELTEADNNFSLSYLPKESAAGWRYHLGEARYGWRLAWMARRWKCTHAFVQSGTTHHFALFAFRLFGIKVIPILHNTLWPSGYQPTSFVPRAILLLDAMFFRWGANAILGVSPECLRQVDQITKGKHGPLYPLLPQFDQSLFKVSEPPPFYPTFKLLFAGRIAENKGVFDLIEIMRRLEDRSPGRFTLDICGEGPDMEALESTSSDLKDTIHIHGFTAPEILRQMISRSHASIVPTKSGFAEGLAMTAVEPILLGRPVITSSVVPALEVLRPACVEAITDDVDSYVEVILDLAASKDKYDNLRGACGALASRFFDQSKSSRSALSRMMQDLEH